MAFSPKLISFLFLFTIFSMQIHARESQFFSKVSSSTTPTTTAQDKTLPNKQQENLNKREQEPAFIPDTQNNGYGLYGQESTQFPTTTKLGDSPSTTTNKYLPYKTQLTQTQQSYNNYPTDSNPNYNNNYNNNNYKKNNQYSNNQYNNNNGYHEEQQQDFGHETSYQESGYTTMGNQNNNYNYNNNYNGANRYNNNADQRQGMSDTRYLEHGMYYYDLKNENNNNYHPNQYQQNSRDNYNTNKGYYNNNNNENSNYEYYNNNKQRYDNQDDFEESPEDQYDP